MFTYTDERGSISIDFEKGCISKLYSKRLPIKADTILPIFEVRLRNQDCSVTELNAFQGVLNQLDINARSVRASYRYAGADITVTVRFGGEHWAVWRMTIVNHSNAAIEWVDFPQIPLIRERNCHKASFYWPYNEGVCIDDLDLREHSGWGSKETEFPGIGSYALFPGMVESQFVAYELNRGLYLGAHDVHRGLKNIDIVSGSGYARLKMRIYAGGEFGSDYSTDFDVILDFFDSGWESAADIYRGWFEKNLPDGLKKLSDNASLPEWYRDSPLVVTYPVRGLHDMDEMQPNRLFPYENALPRIEELAEKLDCRIMVLLMHWEGTAPWAPPFVWPPYGGEAMLKAFIDKLHDKGHLIGVYLSGIGWTLQSNLIESYNTERLLYEHGYERDMCLSPNGELLESMICTGQRHGYDLCPMGVDTQNIVCEEIRKMAEAGIDYAQILDQNHGGNPYFCYSREHGHAPTPGSWMTESMRKLLERANSTGSGMVFGCESAAGEPYLPYLMLSDCRFNLNWIYGRPVPMFSYIYHEYLMNFMGNQVCAGGTFEPDPESLSYRLAYSFAAGDLPTLVITDSGRIMQAWGDRQFAILPDEEQTLQLVRSMISLRRGKGSRFLNGGRMIPARPLENIPKRTFRMKVLHGILAVDSVLTSRWYTPIDGEAQLLVNWTKESINCSIDGRNISVPALTAELIEY